MKNIIFTIVFAAICSVSAFAAAYDFSAVCSTGQTLYYDITSNVEPYTVKVTYPGYSSDGYYYGFTRPTGNLVIPASVTYNNIEYSVTEISSSAFDECSGLTSVTIPNSVTRIGNYVFEQCSGLTSVTIPNSVTSIGERAFYGTGWYNNQPNGILYLDGWCLGYKGNNPTGELTINEGTRGIAGSAFYECSGLTSVTIPNSVAYIGNDAFYRCSGLTGTLTIPNSVTSIGGSAFYNCSGLTSVTIGNSVESISSYAFEGCSGLISLTIGNSVTSINKNAFKGCSGLTTVNYNATNCTTMGTESYPVFANCSSFTLNIGANVAIIPENAFKGCSSFTSIVSAATNPPAIYASSFDSSLSPMTPLTVPCGTVAEYQRYWYYFRNIQEDCSGIEETGIADMQIYPNPATDVLNITSSENISKIEIVNTLGQVVMQMDVNDDNAVCDVNGLTAGVYIVRIHGTDTASVIQKKFIKE